MGGAALVALSRHGEQGGGIGGALLVAAAATVYALWIVLQRRALRTLSPLHLTAWGTWFGALLALPFGGGLPTSLGDATGGAVAALLVLGLVLSTVPFLLWAWVLQRMPASLAAPALLTIGPVGVCSGGPCSASSPHRSRCSAGRSPSPAWRPSRRAGRFGCPAAGGAGARTPTRLTAPAAGVPQGANLLAPQKD